MTMLDGTPQLDDFGVTTTVYEGVAPVCGTEVDFSVEVPGTILDPHPLLIAPGFIEAQEPVEDFRHAVATRGKPAITLDHTRSIAWLHQMRANNWDPERVKAKALWAVAKTVRELLDFERLDAFCHSEGGENGTRVAQRHPDFFRSVILAGSVGMTGEGGLWSHARIMPGVVRGEIVPLALEGSFRGNERALLRGAAHYLFRNPIRTGLEIRGICNADLRPRIMRLGQMGVATAAYQWPDDKFFDVEKAREHVGDVVDLFYVGREGLRHVAPVDHPEEVAEETIQILDTLHGQEFKAAA